MAYDAQGHKLTRHRGEVGYWDDDGEEPVFVRSTAGGDQHSTSTASKVAAALEGVENPTYEQTLAARQSVDPGYTPPAASAPAAQPAADTAAPAPKWTYRIPIMGQGEDGATPVGYDTVTGYDERENFGQWEGPGAENMKSVGMVSSPSTGINGRIFTDGNGNYFHNGKNLGWTPERAQAELGATATATRQAQEHKADSFDYFMEKYMPVMILAGGAAAMSFGSLAGASAGVGETAAALGADGGMFGLPTATSAGGISGGTVGASTAGAGLIESAAIEGSELTGQAIASGQLTSPAALETAGLSGAEAAGNAWMPPGGATVAPFTTGSKIVDWAAKQVIGSVVKGAVASTIGGGPARAGAPAVTGAPAAEQKVSFGTFGLLDMPSAFKPVTRTKFQVDKTALENSGITYTP